MGRGRRQRECLHYFPILTNAPCRWLLWSGLEQDQPICCKHLARRKWRVCPEI